MEFDLPKEERSIIKVIGVGGGGCNAVNHMFRQGITGVNFVICNTDAQALELSPVPSKIHLGFDLTAGCGAGSNPEVGKKATEESMEAVREVLSKETKMVFITAGMGGGTGTGGAPVIAEIAREMGILVVGIVTVPFNFEGKRRHKQASDGVAALKEHVDTILVVDNEKLREIYGNLPLTVAFNHADDVLTTAAKGIAEIITVPGYVNVDFEDVRTVMKNSGVAIMGTAAADGDDRAIKAVRAAMASPLLADNDISGAKYILLNITSGTKEVLMDEISEITDYVQEKAGNAADVIWGNNLDVTLEEKLVVTVIATGFDVKKNVSGTAAERPQKTVLKLEEEPKSTLTVPTPAPSVSSINNILKPDLGSNKTLNKPEPFFVTKKEEPADIREFFFDVPSQAQVPTSFIEEKNVEEKEEMKLMSKTKFNLDDTTISGNIPPVIENRKRPDFYPIDEPSKKDTLNELTQEDIKRNDERSRALRSLSFKINHNNINDLEKEPAYKRRSIPLEDVPHSSESNLSRYTLLDSELDGKPTIRKNNSFLHDNVD